jgi:excinuclease ABC subunit A
VISVLECYRENNLKNLDVVFPPGVMTVVTGVSGSGKSTLVNDILYRALAKQLYRSREEPGAHRSIGGAELVDKVIRIDQSPIGRTPRSNPATYTGMFAQIRDLYAMLPESRERGQCRGRASTSPGGRCEAVKAEVEIIRPTSTCMRGLRWSPLQSRDVGGVLQGMLDRLSA